LWSFGKTGACPALAVCRNGASVESAAAERSATVPGSKNRINASCEDELRGAISGGVALPGHELYHEACRVWNDAVLRVEDGPTVLAHACQLGAEGIVSKRVDGTYRSGPFSQRIQVA
jgi:hypothetical protein